MSNETPFIDKLGAFSSLGLKHPAFISLLLKATREYRSVERYVNELLRRELPKEAKLSFREQGGTSEFFQRNFFSILFVSLFISAGIEEKRRRCYGTILHCLRAIVTCTDNIIDDESKGTIFLELPGTGNVLGNVLITIAMQNIISTEAAAVSYEPQNTLNRLLSCLHSVAVGEAFAHNHCTGAYPQPQEIIDKVHRKIGSELLQLSFVAPLQNETACLKSLEQYEQGVLKIGLSLQMLDDCQDILEDISENKLNLFASVAVHEAGTSFEQLIGMAEAGVDLEKEFADAKAGIVRQAVAGAREGFAIMAGAGYPVNASEIDALLKAMFVLRGLSRDWQIIESQKE
ncbi:MAG: class 1 isoprenoid biosynthesis enzyme [Phycisphaerae bacterium]